MKLKVYQQGGGLIYTPFIPQPYTSDTGSKKALNGGGEEDKLDPLDKEILSLMKSENLLPSDIAQIYNRLITFQKKSQSLTGMGGSYRSAMPGMLQIMQMTSLAKANKANWDDTLSEVKKHNAGSEVALDAYGRMWVSSEDGIKKINPSEFDSEKYTPISNSQLLYMRERNPELAFSDELFGETGMDVIGAEDIRKEIDDIISKFGTIKSAEFQKKKFQEIAQDLQGEGIYKITTKYSKADLNDFSGLLYSRLSAAAKHLINANAAIGGYKPNDYITSIIKSQTDIEIDPQYESTLTKANGAGGSGGSGGDDEKNLVADSYIEELARGNNFQMPRMTIFNPTSRVNLHAFVQNTGVMNENDGSTPISPGMADAIFEKISLKQISPQMTVTFGDQIIDERNLGQLMYDGSALQRVDLPFTEINGEVTVDWSTIEAVEEANKQLEERSVTPGMIKELVEQNPKLVWNEKTKRVEAKDHMWFLTFGAIMADDFVTKDVNLTSTYLEKMNNDKKDYWKDKYTEAIIYGFVNHTKNDPKRTDHVKTKWGWPIKFDFHSNFYHGNVFMPILNTLAGVTEYSSKNSRLNNSQTQAAADRQYQIQQGVNTGQISLNW